MKTELLADFYGASADRARLTHGLDRVREMTNAASATLHVFQRSATRLRHQWQHACSRTPLSAHSLAQLDDQNPRTLTLINPPSTQPCLLEDAAFPEVLHRQVYDWQQQLQALGMGRFIAARISLDQDREVGLAIHAKVDGSAVVQGTADLMVELMPHLREAVLLAAKVDADACRDEVLRTAFQQMQPGFVTVSGDGTILSINRSARRLLGLSDAAVSLPPSLQARISNCASRGFLCWHAGGRHLHLCIRALPDTPETMTRLCPTGETWLLAMRDVEEDVALSDEEWAGCYGLTPAEIAILGSVASGEDISGIAAKRSISIHTARTQLKSVMAKVGVRRQSQLVRIAWSSPAASLGSQGAAADNV